MKISYTDDSVAIDSFEREAFGLLRSRDVGRDISERQQIQVFLVSSQDQDQDDDVAHKDKEGNLQTRRLAG
jgi:hypothetical protein